MAKKLTCVFLSFLLAGLSAAYADTRSEKIDFVILIDTSLSMADAIQAARSYAAGDIIGRLVEPDDWVAVIKFYGSVETVWEGYIRNADDIQAIVKSLHALKANGRFTDIGAALDDMDALLRKRGHPERPKYILLITDERQEAPRASRYYSNDFSLSHPLLKYIKRADMGKFRVITVGYKIDDKVESGAESLLKTLNAPPARTDPALPGSGSDWSATQLTGTEAQGQPPLGQPSGQTQGSQASGIPQGSAAPQSGSAQTSGQPPVSADNIPPAETQTTGVQKQRSVIRSTGQTIISTWQTFIQKLDTYGTAMKYVFFSGIFVFIILIVLLCIALKRKHDRENYKRRRMPEL